MNKNHSLLVEKYRPDTLENYVGNEHIKKTISQYLSQNDIQTIKNYIIISKDVYFYFDEEADKTKYDISEIDMTKISLHEVEELFSSTPLESMNKMILIGKYLFGIMVKKFFSFSRIFRK